MNKLVGIDDGGRQKHTFGLPDGTRFNLLLEYSSINLGWFMTVTYGDFQTQILVATCPNMLHQFRNILPFGLGCMTTDNEEPTTQQDFNSGRSQLVLLSADEVALYGRILSGQVSA